MKIKDDSHHLGDEADVLLRYQHNNHWQFTSILGYFTPGDLEQINLKMPKNALWFSIQVMFTLN